MSSVDSRIVTIKFDNATFERNARTSLTTLEKLKSSMNFGTVGAAATKGLGGISSMFSKFIGMRNPFSSAQKGVTDLQQQTDGFKMTGLTGGISQVSKSFVAMSTIAITALSNIVNRAVDAGLMIGRSLTVDPIKLGLEEYETNLNSIQTILANTQVSGATLKDVNNALNELNEYSDKTIYNFSEMAKNIGTFTAAGVDLDTSVASIKGIANLAALSGSNSQQAATAMYQLSQEISAGRVSLMGWNSVVNAGMGGSAFQRALAQTAVAMGEIDENAISLEGKMKNVKIEGQSFRDSIMAKPGEQSWLSSDVLLETLKQFTGDMSRADLAAQGFKDSQIDAIMEMAKTAQDAATKVKTMTQLIDVAKETSQSGWKETWQLIFGDFKEARTLFTNASNAVNQIITNSADARNAVLKDWKALGGRDALIQGIADGWESFLSIIRPIKNAFRDIFPATTGKQLFDLTVMFADLMKSMKAGSETAKNIRRTFRGVFAIFGIGWEIVKGLAGVIFDLFGVVGEGTEGFLGFTGGIGDWLTAVHKAIADGGALEGFFDGLSAVLEVPIRLVQTLAGFIGDIFNGFSGAKAGEVDGALNQLGERFGWLSAIGERLSEVFSGIAEFLEPLGEAIGQALSNIGSAVADGLASGDYSGLGDALNVGIFATIALLIRKFINSGLSVDLTGGLFGQVGDSFDQLTDTMKSMQTQIQAKTLLLIAGAIALLTASVVALSLIDSAKLTKALTAMAVGFGQLLSAMAVLVAVSGSAGFVKVPIIAASMVLLAGAVLILVGAVAALSRLSWEELGRGLAGVAGILTAISLFANTLGGSVLTIGALGLAMIPLALGIGILAGVVAGLAKMKWEDLGKGLAGLAGIMTILVVALNAMSGGIVGAAALLIITPALMSLIPVLGAFAGMSWEEIGKAMTVLAGSMTILVLALNTMSGGIVGAAALLIITPALLGLAKTMTIMGKLGWEEIGKGMVTLAGALTILAVGLTAMIIALPGAVALLVLAPALAALVAVLGVLGNMAWGTILKGLASLVLMFATLGISAAILSPLIPLIFLLGVALTAVGVGVTLVGAGAFLLATAFTLIAASGNQVLSVLGNFLSMLPDIAVAFVKAMVASIQAIARGSGKIIQSFGRLIGQIVNVLIKLTPKFGRLMDALIETGLRVIRNNFPNFVRTGMAMLMALLNGLDKNINKITTKAVDIAVKFMNAIGRESPRLIKAGKNMIIDIGKGIAREIVATADEMYQKAKEIGSDIISGIVNAIKDGLSSVTNAISDMAGNAIDAAKDKFGIGGPSKVFCEIGNNMAASVATGVDGQRVRVNKSMDELGRGAVLTMSKSLSRLNETMVADIDMNPTIAPVLDLTQMTKEANRMSSILSTKPISADVSYDQASDISAQTQAAAEAAFEQSEREPAVRDVSFVQNNTSPKALGAVELYRQTRNQFSLAKEALGIE